MYLTVDYTQKTIREKGKVRSGQVRHGKGGKATVTTAEFNVGQCVVGKLA